MFYLIETSEQLKDFTQLGYKEAYCEIIPLSNHLHPLDDEMCLIYLRPLLATKGYLISINHSEAFKINLKEIEGLLNSFKKIYVTNLKDTWHFVFSNVFSPIYPLPSTYVPNKTKTHEWFYQKYPKLNNINSIIPIVKHYESCELNFNVLSSCFELIHNESYIKKYNIVFKLLEENPIHINKSIFEDYFWDEEKDYVRTQYNLNTLTSRPSNSFNNLNFSSLNKTNGERKSFIPSQSIFIELDLTAYHPTLLANLIGYSFSSTDIHNEFSVLYGVDYQKAKEITFKQIYGGVWKKYEHLEFFKKTKDFTQNLWEEFNLKGYIECPISKHRFIKSHLSDMNPQKLLNYLLQNLETSNNVFILWEIIKLLKNKKTRLVLYVYDSFLLDYSEEENLLEEILQIFNSKNLSVKIKHSADYNL